METPREYHYTYYSYEEWGRGYIGSRTCKCLPEEDVRYFGSFSDKTFRPTNKIILKSDYKTREECNKDEIALQKFYKVIENPHFSNRAYQTSTKFYVSFEIASNNGKKYGKIIGEKSWKNKTGMFSLTTEQRREIGIRNHKNKKGAHSLSKEQKSQIGMKTYIEKKGIHSLTKEEKIEFNRKLDERNKIEKKGIYSLSKDDKVLAGKKVASQRWKCLETGFITNAGNLTKYQRARGIDTSKRVRIQ